MPQPPNLPQGLCMCLSVRKRKVAWEIFPLLLAGLAHCYSLILHLKATSSEITTDSGLKVKTPFFTQFLSIPPSNFFSTMYHNRQSSCSSFVFHENVNSTEAGTSGLRIHCYISPVLVHSKCSINIY